MENRPADPNAKPRLKWKPWEDMTPSDTPPVSPVTEGDSEERANFWDQPDVSEVVWPAGLDQDDPRSMRRAVEANKEVQQAFDKVVFEGWNNNELTCMGVWVWMLMVVAGVGQKENDGVLTEKTAALMVKGKGSADKRRSWTLAHDKMINAEWRGVMAMVTEQFHRHDLLILFLELLIATTMRTNEKARGLPVEIQKSILLTPALKANTITGTIMETLDGPEDDFVAPAWLIHWSAPAKAGLNHEVAVVVLNPQAAEAWGMLLQVGKPGARVPMKFKRANDFPSTNDQAFFLKKGA